MYNGGPVGLEASSGLALCTQSILTILPSLPPATTFLPLKKRLATLQAVTSDEGVFAQLVRGFCGCAVLALVLARAVEGDGKSDSGASCRGGHAEGL